MNRTLGTGPTRGPSFCHACLCPLPAVAGAHDPELHARFKAWQHAPPGTTGVHWRIYGRYLRGLADACERRAQFLDAGQSSGAAAE